MSITTNFKQYGSYRTVEPFDLPTQIQCFIIAYMHMLLAVIWKIFIVIKNFVDGHICENLSREIILTQIISYKINVKLCKLNN